MGVVKVFLPAIFVACAVSLAACGGSSSSTFHYEPLAVSRPAPPASDFPPASGKTLKQVLESADGPLRSQGLAVEPTAQVFYPGRDRFPMQVTTKSKASVANVDIAIYLSKVSKPVREQRANSGPARAPHVIEQPAEGPFPASVTTLATEAEFLATSTAEDPRSATAVYVAPLDFPTNGEWLVGAVVKDGQRTYSTTLTTVRVGEFTRIPKVGEAAPSIHTPTLASANGNLAAISTRRSPSTMNEVDFASVLGRKPIMLVFASPKFSFNGTAGPTVDAAEEVRQRFRGRAEFINMEIYNENDPSQGVRPQVRAYHLPSQPWVFAIDRRGRIVGEAEGAVGVGELTRLARRAVQ